MLSEDKVRALRFELLADANKLMRAAAARDQVVDSVEIARLGGMVSGLSAVLEDHDLPDWDFLGVVAM